MSMPFVASTRISVGSTGAPGATPHGASAPDEAPATGFDMLLAGAHETDDTTDPNTTPTDDCTTQPDDATDPAGLAAALGAGAVVPPTPITPPATAITTPVDGEAVAADPVPTTPVATPLDINAILAAAPESEAETPPTAFIDVTTALTGEADADATTDAAPEPLPAPKILPTPDLPTASASAGDTEADAAPTIALRPSPAAETARLAADTTRSTPSALLPSTSPAAFAAVVPGPNTIAANANVSSAAVTSAATAAPSAPTEQIVSVLTPMRSEPNGTYTLRLELRPPELGRVEMRVEMRDGVLHASIHAEHESSAQQLRNALGDLRERLGAGGVQTGQLSVSDGGVGSRRHERAGGQSATGAPSQTTTDDETDPQRTAGAVPNLDPEATSLLDVRV